MKKKKLSGSGRFLEGNLTLTIFFLQGNKTKSFHILFVNLTLCIFLQMKAFYFQIKGNFLLSNTFPYSNMFAAFKRLS